MIKKFYSLIENSSYYDKGILIDCKPLVNDDAFCNEKYKIISNRLTPEEIKSLFGKRVYHNREFLVFWSLYELNLIDRTLAKKRRNSYGVKYTDKHCCNHIPGKGNNPEKIVDKVHISLTGKKMSFSCVDVSKEDLEIYYEKIKEYSPIWMELEEDFFNKLLEYICDNNLKIPSTIKYVELKSKSINENNYSNYPFLVKRVLYNDVSLAYAYECTEGKFHLINELVYVELFEENGKQIALISSLINKTFPIIRYPVENLEIKQNVRCACGCNNQVLILEV